MGLTPEPVVNDGAESELQRESGRPPQATRLLDGPVRRVTTVTPMLNEGARIEQFVADIAAQDFRGEIEVIVADGGSSDESIARLEAACRAHALDLTVLHNPRRWVSPALNACIRCATGELIVRLDCHTRYPPNYIRLTVAAAEDTGAWSIGGIVHATGSTLRERAIAAATDSPFGGALWTRHPKDAGRTETDTVYLGSWPPAVFERIGGFDEDLVRNQDDEFSLRIRSAGGRILLDTAIASEYTPRGSFVRLFRQYRQYGFWKIPVMLKHRRVVSARSLAPVALVTSVTALALTGLVTSIASLALAVETLLYLGASLSFGARSLRARREPLALLPLVVASYATCHAGYGVGFVHAGLVALRGDRDAFARRARKSADASGAPTSAGTANDGPGTA